jgi:hypothetical protein
MNEVDIDVRLIPRIPREPQTKMNNLGWTIFLRITFEPIKFPTIPVRIPMGGRDETLEAEAPE